MNRVNFGIIGCGGAAVPVGEAISASPLACLAMVHDVDLSLARAFGESRRVPFTDDVNTLLGDPRVQAVYIGVPHDLLAPLARRALEAGKHVLVEKPMALTLADADALIALAEAQHLALGVFYELRYAAPFVQARELIRAGAIGRIIGVRIQTLIDKPESYWRSGLSGRSVNPWRGQKARAGGGVVLMNTSHQFDAIAHLTGLEVVSVSAEVGTLAARVEVEDTGAACLRYDNGAIGSLFAGAHLPGVEDGERFDIYGTDGQLRLPDPYGNGSASVFLRREWGEFPAGEWRTLPVAAAPAYTRAVEDFARAVQEGRLAPIGGRDARRVLEVVLAIYQSALERRTISWEAR
jgi:UDP-N-acetyl-2-amino-2-deoxyglucuronate dehydrogenase